MVGWCVLEEEGELFGYFIGCVLVVVLWFLCVFDVVIEEVGGLEYGVND